MRILHIVPTYLPATRYGGPIYSVHALCRAQARRGHDVQVFTTDVDGPGVSDVPLGRPVDLDGVKITYFPTSIGRRLYRSPAMGQALAAQVSRFDVLHLHSVFLWPTAAAAAVARRQRVPYVLAPRGMLVADLIRRRSRLVKSAWIAAFERRNLAGAAAVHVTAELEAEELRKLGYFTQRIEVIPNGVEIPANAPARGVAGALGPTVLCLGRVNWKKGLDRLVRAMADVPGANLVIAGDEEDGYLAELEGLARELGIEGRTHFLGPVHGESKWALIASADVFVLASHSENFGNAVLEAMAMGVPVVVTPGVGLAATVAREGVGLVVDGDPASIAAGVNALLGDPGRRRRMGETARLVAVQRFSWDSVAAASERLYEELGSAGTARAPIEQAP